MAKGGKAKSELKTPEIVTNHPVGDERGLIIGCPSCGVIYQRVLRMERCKDADLDRFTSCRKLCGPVTNGHSDPEGAHLNM